MQQLPDGYIVKTENPDDSFLVYGELSGRGFVSKGYRLEIPNLGNANNGLKNDLFFPVVRLAGVANPRQENSGPLYPRCGLPGYSGFLSGGYGSKDDRCVEPAYPE